MPITPDSASARSIDLGCVSRGPKPDIFQPWMRSARSTTTAARAASRADGQGQRIEHFAERGGAIEAANALEQPGDTGHLGFALARARGGDGFFQRVGGARFAIGQRLLHAGLGGGQAVGHLQFDLGLDLAANFARGDLAVFGAGGGNGCVQAVARTRGFGVGDACLRGLFRFG